MGVGSAAHQRGSGYTSDLEGSVLIDITTVCGILVAVFALLVQIGQRRFELAQQYIGRFWAIDDDIVAAGTDDERALHCLRYARLCEDEMEVVALGWIDRRTWSVWHEGIVSTAAVERIDRVRDSFELLGECFAHPHHSATECPAWKRRPVWRRVF